ncbi:hypothetical protein INH39_02780 [Massilia violaceinigra]|uniref:Uncharacterized protein n=1 Tax=Massilia violaceinigra TaxID=2045208 RepID=A0ABY4A7Q0_9BURK|nr:hypothetical protein [Massilia violaceinigra]UOD30688.1 hypothetical protein INH39_02780 [Massilia violaceinigra]
MYYESAARDPTPIPSVLILTFLTMVIALYLGYSSGELRSQRRKNAEAIDFIDNPANRPPPPTDAQLRADFIIAAKWLRRLEIVKTFTTSILLVALLTYLSLVTSSIEMWKNFNVNMTICAPHISDLEEKQLRAKFVQMKSKKDYVALEKELAATAAKYNLKLRVTETW